MAQELRQNNLFAAEDWTVIYKAFTEVNFNAYDFDSIREAMVNYMRINFPEDFNDYIESSEFIALIDLLAYLGQSLAFRMDLNTRENFIDTAERRESLLRLAKLVNYQPSRNSNLNGLMKVTSITTNEDVFDSLGQNLSNRNIFFNDPNNPDWFEQFILVLNASFVQNNPFGIPVKQGTVEGINTQLYQFNNVSGVNPAQQFTASINGENTSFEFTNVNFNDNGTFFEKSPDPTESKNIIFRSDGNGNTSPRTGFFLQFKEGNLQFDDFQFDVPIENRSIDINVNNINNTDVFLQNIDDNGIILDTWTPVPAVVGNNIIFNQLENNIRNIYNVITRENDQITVQFSDGRFGQIPTGIFRVWYRTSLGERLKIKPRDMNQQSFIVPYRNTSGQLFTLTITLQLQETVDNSGPSETNDEIRRRAPQVFYSQNRMVNGQDYNVFPLQNNNALKVKSVNRTYSGHSRYIDINDPTASRKDANVFADDGILYKELNTTFNELNLPTGLSPTEITIKNIDPQLKNIELQNFIYQFLPKEQKISNINNNLTETSLVWEASQNFSFVSTGTFNVSLRQSSASSDVPKDNINEGTLLKFNKSGWVSVTKILNEGNSIFPNGEGQVKLSKNVENNEYVEKIIPTFKTILTPKEKEKIINEIENQNSFGISFDFKNQEWFVINSADLDANSKYSLKNQKDKGFSNRDASWLLRVEFSNSAWKFFTRGLKYVFESDKDVRFFFLNRFRTTDPDTGIVQRDNISILKSNTNPNNKEILEKNYYFELFNEILEDDGFIEPRRIELKLWDNDFNGVPDEPDAFDKIVNPDSYVFQEKTKESGFERYKANNNILTVSNINDMKLSDFKETDTIFVIENNINFEKDRFYKLNISKDNLNKESFKKISNYTSDDVLQNSFKSLNGRNSLYFQWKHFSPKEHRIDPAITNVIDIFVLDRNFDTSIREWIQNNEPIEEKPEAPSSEQLKLTFSELENFKMISDEIIWRPVEHKILFGSQAKKELQAKFKVIKLPNSDLSDGEIKSNVVNAINDFFLPENWDFGETFYGSELTAFIHLRLPGDVSSVALVPLNEESKFGRLQEVKSLSNEIFISSVKVKDVEIIQSNTATNLRIGK